MDERQLWMSSSCWHVQQQAAMTSWGGTTRWPQTDCYPQITGC